MNAEQYIEGSREYINDVLRQLFEGHGVTAGVKSGRCWLTKYYLAMTRGT